MAMLRNYAIFRLPGQGGRCELVECEDSELRVYAQLPDLGMEHGYVVAPFRPCQTTPVVVLGSRQTSSVDIGDLSTDTHTAGKPLAQCPVAGGKARSDYGEDFNAYRRAIAEGKLRKVVLARSQRMEVGSVNPLHVFRRAVEQNPDSYVALFSTSLTGTWLTATPETLLQAKDGEWQTMALAGTRPVAMHAQPWDMKNTEEQAIVADYIRQCLQPYAASLREHPTTTLRYGKIEHIFTRFSLKPEGDPARAMGDALRTLHPTPAVSGLPREEATSLIIRQEHCQRQYYSGFSGPIASPGEFSLWVTLRCMRIDDAGVTLYAGGGIMPDSKLDSEWQETVAKMQSMVNSIMI